MTDWERNMTIWERSMTIWEFNYDYLGKISQILYLVVNQINDSKIENNLFVNLFISAGAFKLRKATISMISKSKSTCCVV